MFDSNREGLRQLTLRLSMRLAEFACVRCTY